MTTTSYNIYQQITSVRLSSTANLSGNYFNGALNNGVGATLTALSVGALSVDGILVEVGDRLLLKDQTSSNQNGLYVVQSSGSSSGLWMIERAPDFQSLEQLKVGQYFSVGAGATLAGSMFVLVEPLPTTIGLGTFNFVDVADVDTPSGPFLLKSANFTDVANPETAFKNLGTGTGLSITITDSDFSGGVYQIPVPFPVQVVCDNLSVGGQQIRLPVANIDIALSDGTLIDNLEGFDQSRYLCNDKSTSAGAYTILPELYLLNSLSGRVDLISNDSSVTITPNTSNNTIDLSVAVAGGVTPSQMIFVDAINGNDSNTGSISSPLQSYEAARLLAVSRNPQYGTGQTIVAMTALSITGDMTISPYVSVVGFGKYCSIIGVTGDIVLDASWGTTAFPETNISNIAFVANSINFVYPSFQTFSIIRFENCSLQLLNVGPTATITGSDNSGTTECETVIFLNCTLDLVIGELEPQFISNNINMFLFNSSVSNAIVSSVTSSTVGAILLVQDAIANVGNITLTATSTGTLATQISGCNTQSSALTINGTSNTVTIDADSYKFNGFIFSGGANFSNINGGIPLIIYIDQLNGNDNNSGTINYPMKNYEQARLAAIARLGSDLQTQGCLIVVVGTHNITGDMTLTPGISIDSQSSPYKSGFIVTGNVILDSSWGTTFSLVQVRNIYIFLSGGGIYSFVFPAMDATGNSFLKFANCEFNTLTTMIITGAGSSNGIEEVTFENCTNDLQNYSPGFTAENVNLYLINNDLSASNISMTVSTALGFNYVLAINNARFYTGNISVITNNTSTLTTYITASNTAGKTLSVTGTNNTINIDASSYQFASLVFSGGASYSNIKGSSPQVIYISQLTGNDSNSGTINYPLQNYEAARLLALARGASDVFEFTIIVVGNQNISGDVILSPNVSIQSFGSNYNGGFNVNGNVVIDPNWGATIDAYCLVKDLYIYISGGNYNFIFPNARPFSFLKFVNCAFNTGGFITIMGTGTVGGTENVTFENCTAELLNYTPGFIAENVNLYLINTDLTVSDITFTASSATGLEYTLVVNNARFYTDNIDVISNNTSTAKAYINASNTMGKTLTLNGVGSFAIVDSTSYMFTLALANSATLANLTLPTKTDGMTNASYTPLHYTPAGDTLYGANTLTGNIKGIDNALPKASGSTTLVGGTVTVSSSSVANGDSIELTRTVSGGVPGFPVVTYSAGVSFTITSTNALDTSTFKWKNLGA